MKPIEYYNHMVATGKMLADPNQQAALISLEKCYEIVCSRQNDSMFSKIAAKLRSNNAHQAGVYLWGGVGIGKTCLMDIFFRSLPSERKQRIHFHRFMKEIHQQLRHWQGQSDPLTRIAKSMRQKIDVLCFDEFFIVDIADAMLIGKILSSLLQQGIILVMTSNLAPDDLYKNGLQRQQFLPTIALIKKHCQIIHLSNITDYRLLQLQNDALYHYPINPQNRQRMADLFSTLCHSETQETAITIENREIPILAVGDNIIWFDAPEIIAIPRCQRDWLEISNYYQIVFISNLKAFDKDQHNLVRNFITMIDIFYDAQIKLVIEAETAITELYPIGRLHFEFERTKSRLIEMQSQRYLHGSHLHLI